MLVQKYDYKPINRKNINGKRHYCCPDGSKVPSVTTILDKTKPQESVQKLQNWRKRTGYKEAAKITKQAAQRGESVHSYLEEYCKNGSLAEKIKGRDGKPSDFVLNDQGYKMAEVIINEDLGQNLNEVWGTEASLYFSELYAGTTDCVGVYENIPCVVDFKQTNKPKRREWIDDYFLQLSAYIEAHNNMFGTKINRGVILMCSKDLQFQRFIIEGAEFEKYKHMWWDRVADYYKYHHDFNNTP